jgi:hypothetical protein
MKDIEGEEEEDLESEKVYWGCLTAASTQLQFTYVCTYGGAT